MRSGPGEGAEDSALNVKSLFKVKQKYRSLILNDVYQQGPLNASKHLRMTHMSFPDSEHDSVIVGRKICLVVDLVYFLHIRS